MRRTILVPLDGSAFAEHALPVARSIAVRSGAAIVLTHVHVSMLDFSTGDWLVSASTIDDTVDADQRRREMDFLTSRSSALVAGDIEVSVNLLGGSVVPALVEHAVSIAADLVVMTTHGRGTFSRLWLGSVADAFVRHSPVPTLLVRPPHEEQAAQPDVAQPFAVRRMLIPLDASSLAEQILDRATALARTMDAEVLLLHVVEPRTFAGYTTDGIAAREGERMQPMLTDAQTYLDGVAEQVREQGLTVQVRVEVAQQTARTILDVAQQHDCDLIALATLGRGSVARMVMGSVADKIVRGATTPVLLLRPGQHGDRAAGASSV